MNRRSSDFTSFSSAPEQLVEEVHNAQKGLAIAEHHIGCSAQRVTPYTTYHFFAAHKALHEAHKAIDRIIEMLRAQAARSVKCDDAQREPAR